MTALRDSRLFQWLACAALLATAAARAQPAAPASAPMVALVDVITALDKQHFDAFNGCDLKTLESLYAPDAEFYHDLNGKVMGREQLLAAIRKNICGKVQRRALGPIEVHPLAGVGAIEMGRQCFFRVGQNACEQEGKTFMLWRFDGTAWRLTRVFSYDHANMP
jgi:hypothetical protein